MWRWLQCLAVLSVLLSAPLLAQEPEWVLYPDDGLAYTLLREGGPYLRIDCVCWGPGWAWFGFGRGTVTVDGPRRFTAAATVGGTDRRMEMVHSASQSAPNEVALQYRLNAPEGAELTQIVVSVRPDEQAFRGGRCVAVLASGERTEVSLPFGRGPIGQAVTRLLLVDAAGRETALEISPNRPVTMDGDGRIALAQGSVPAAESIETSVTLRTPNDVQFYPDREATLQRSDTSDWFPYPVGPSGVPIDLSFLNKDDSGQYVVAGSHGFLTVDGDRFVFADGTPATFWGVNLTAGAVLGPPERAAQLAERLARLGVNVVRLHHLDSWANPIVDYNHPDGTTQHFSAPAMKALDRTIYELKSRGIYVIPDPWVQRCFTAKDGVPDYGGLGRRGNFGLHPYIYFDARMQELIGGQWEHVWTHVNEFTGVAYKDEPAIVMTEVINEGLLIGLEGVREVYRPQVLELYGQWAAANDGVPAEQANLFTQNWGDNNLRFFTWLHRRFYGRAYEFLRSVGVRVPINATNWAHFTWVMAAQTDQDFMDSHHYYGGDRIGPGHGLGGLWLNHPPGVPDSPFGKIAGFAVAGKPVASSECGNNPPKTYRAAYQLGLAAVAALQGWDSITGYAYSQAGSPQNTLSPYEWETDPASIASIAVGALLLRRGDVSPARETVVLDLPEQHLLTLHWQNRGERQHWNTPGFNAALEQHRVLVKLPGQELDQSHAGSTMAPEEAFAYEHPNTELRSDTGQLWRDWNLGVGLIDTPRTQVAYGKLGESAREWRTTDCAFAVSTPFAVVALSSLTGEPLSGARRILLTAVARAQNTGMAANMARTSIVENGGPPVIAEPVVGTVRLRTSASRLRLHPIHVDGSRGPGVDAPVADGSAHIELRGDSRTIFYELEAGD
jgi:hypothetical protein